MVEEIRVEGILRRLDSDTPWDYGSHRIEQDGLVYLLASDEVNISDYEGRPVWLSGRIVEHYTREESCPSCVRVSEIDTLYY